jgi:hypothetical protein
VSDRRRVFDRVVCSSQAILAADVAGFSRLVGLDEEGTLAELKELRRTLVDPKMKEYRGRIVKTTGDGMLVRFVSVIDALRCAIGQAVPFIKRIAPSFLSATYRCACFDAALTHPCLGIREKPMEERKACQGWGLIRCKGRWAFRANPIRTLFRALFRSDDENSPKCGTRRGQKGQYDRETHAMYRARAPRRSRSRCSLLDAAASKISWRSGKRPNILCCCTICCGNQTACRG